MLTISNRLSNEVLIVGIGGTFRSGSTTEKAVARVLNHVETFGARTLIFNGAALDFPSYRPGRDLHATGIDNFLDALRAADGIVLGSPGYHGGISGLVKNALDYVEELVGDERVYLDGRAIGCLATGNGWQGANTTLSSLRDVSHALRGWPTPLGIALNSSARLFDDAGACVSPEADEQMRLMASQIVTFVHNRDAGARVPDA